MKIALGSARGLAYLHHDCSPAIVHRDIKSSNILLDPSLDPHVSDFGLAKLLVDEDAHVTTVVAGTFGYLAPGNYPSRSSSFFFCWFYIVLVRLALCFHLLPLNCISVVNWYGTNATVTPSYLMFFL